MNVCDYMWLKYSCWCVYNGGSYLSVTLTLYTVIWHDWPYKFNWQYFLIYQTRIYLDFPCHTFYARHILTIKLKILEIIFLKISKLKTTSLYYTMSMSIQKHLREFHYLWYSYEKDSTHCSNILYMFHTCVISFKRIYIKFKAIQAEYILAYVCFFLFAFKYKSVVVII